ncbi:MAG: NBR1-Ig-like domain-containing protein [Anaerolineales bacterium]|nr:MAG: NBR1-Ig-like domain-containing protein [Anaerolineales bacterium]
MKTRLSAVLLASALIIAACAPAAPLEPTPDVMAIRTSAANTVVAEFTLTAAAFTPTSQPTETPEAEIPTETPTITLATDPTQIALGTPGVLCDDMTFDLATIDVTIIDGTTMTPGQEFIKTWKIKNSGSCAWGEGYGLIFAYGERMNGQAAPLGTLVEVGQEVEVSVNFKAPTAVGEYTSAWQMANARGVTFGKAIFVKIVVR